MENIINLFNNAIGWSILHSLWHGAAIYIALSSAFLFFPKINADNKYKLSYIAQVLLLGCFINTFIKYFHISTANTLEPEIIKKEQFFIHLNNLQSDSLSIIQFFPYIVSLYTLGIITQIILCLRSFQFLDRLKKSSSAFLPLEWINVFEKIKSNNNISDKTTLKSSDHITAPITIGFLKPIIIFPTAYINKISVEDAEAILLHEIAHIKRYDYLFNLILVSIETLLFFNPFMWLISRRINLEREHSCDDFVTNRINNPISYSRTLLQIELLRQELAPKLTMALSGNNKNTLLNRIKRINNQIMETKKTHFNHQMLTILVASVTFIFIAWVNPIDGKQQISKKSPNQETIDTRIEKSIAITTSLDTIEDVKTIKKKKIIIKTDTSEVTLTDNKEVQDYLNTAERKKQLEEIEKFRKQTDETFKSSEWKDMISNLDLNSKNIGAYFDSPEWKEKMAKIELKTQESLDEYFNSEEWKNKLNKIEIITQKKLDKKFNSQEWKDKIAQIEINTQKILEEKFNSPEWKDKMAKIEIKTQKILEETFNSPEWKRKIQDLEKLHNSN
ncbi:M56 family metallopeptidase [Sphingobacterium composti Ten et al. 2007 non Yoo et al. 2007]|uniref:M56 family metallopeptidase n=1 Tax=Sphingobacterium composti TaxID=363260 RepID=UPI00135CD86A|nr:M56 family metallopeptidase [Sphingobacterium composti Ten et al. 2007 non Yoo et al. 2007]